MSFRSIFIFISFLSFFDVGFAKDQVSQKTFEEFKITDGFWKNVKDSFSGTNLLLHGAGIASTYMIVNSGVDANVHEEFKHHTPGISAPGVFIGTGIAAAGLGTHLYFKSKKDNDIRTLGAAWVIAQATIITFTYIHTLKALTGRPNADNKSQESISDQSDDFRFGILRGGIFNGWPSGHVSHTVAVTSALAHYYPEKPWIAWTGVGLSTYMIYTVSAAERGQMHWFSEGIAGAFMGYAIGSTVGKNFRKRMTGIKEEEKSNLVWFPYAAPGAFGANLFYSF